MPIASICSRASVLGKGLWMVIRVVPCPIASIVTRPIVVGRSGLGVPSSFAKPSPDFAQVLAPEFIVLNYCRNESEHRRTERNGSLNWIQNWKVWAV